jgi:hypothetical protein
MSGQKADDEAWLDGIGDPACSLGRRFDVRYHHARVIEEGSARRCQFDAASPAYQELRTYLLLKISNLPA